MTGWLGLLRSFVIYWRPGRQRGLRRLYRPFVGPGDLVFDVGAHVGDRSMAFAALGARVVAVEPQPHIVRWLRRVVARNPDIVVEATAVGAQEGRGELAVSRRTPTVSSLAGEWRRRLTRENQGFRGVRWEDRVEVEITTLDALIRRHGIPRFCKIDVEGFESQVLKGLSRPLDGVSVEFVQGSLDVALECVQRLEELAEYQYNAVAGEDRRFLFPSWRGAGELARWLEEGASEVASGDLYARRPAAVGGEERP